MAKPAKTYDIFKMEDFTKTGRVVTVGYCVYEVATGARVRSYIPTRRMAIEYRDRMNAEAAIPLRERVCTPMTVGEAATAASTVI
jgi:hypothetical protein